MDINPPQETQPCLVGRPESQSAGSDCAADVFIYQFPVSPVGYKKSFKHVARILHVGEGLLHTFRDVLAHYRYLSLAFTVSSVPRYNQRFRILQICNL